MAVDVTVVKRGVLRLPSILCQEVVVARLKVGTHVEGTNFLREFEFAGHTIVHRQNIFLVFKFHNATHAQCQVDVLLLHLLGVLVNIDFKIHPRNERLIVVRTTIIPVFTLLTSEEFQTHAFRRTQCQARTTKGVVDTQCTFFVSAEDKSRAKLVVEVTEGEFSALETALDVHVRHTPPCKVFFKTRKWVFHIFKARTGTHILRLEVKFCVGVGQEVLVRTVVCTDFRVVFGENEHVALNATRERNAIIFLCLSRKGYEGTESNECLFHINDLRICIQQNQ